MKLKQRCPAKAYLTFFFFSASWKWLLLFIWRWRGSGVAEIDFSVLERRGLLLCLELQFRFRRQSGHNQGEVVINFRSCVLVRERVYIHVCVYVCVLSLTPHQATESRSTANCDSVACHVYHPAWYADTSHTPRHTISWHSDVGASFLFLIIFTTVTDCLCTEKPNSGIWQSLLFFIKAIPIS